MIKTTYLDECLQRGIIVRWPTGIMPIKVYISPCRWYASKGNDNYTYKAMAKKAFETWAEISEGLVSFEFVNTLYDSQINLEWKRVERKSLGYCTFSYDTKKRIFSAEVSIGLSDGILHGEYQNMEEVYHTILHEVGHSLGLGHSPFKEDIMHVPHQYGVKELSEIDKKTLRYLYKMPAAHTAPEAIKRICNEPFSSLDEMVMYMEGHYKMPQQQSVQASSSSNSEDGNYGADYEQQRDLVKEQEMIADLNLYKMSLQNIRISPNIKSYINKSVLPDKD